MRTLQATTFTRPLADNIARSSAFTLVELLAVLVITGLVAVSVGYSVRPSLAAAKQASAILRCTAVDRTLREQCVQRGMPQVLWINELKRLEVQDANSGDSRLVDSGLPLLRVLTPSSESIGDSLGLKYLPDGSSPTFCLELGPSTVASRFLVFVGGSGQVLELADEAAIRELFSALRPVGR